MNNEGQGPLPVSVALPPTPFFYTLDQVAAMMALSEQGLRQRVYFTGQTTRRRMPKEFRAVNISSPGKAAVWRISEQDLIKTLREMGIILSRRKLNDF